MESVTVDRLELIEKIKANRDKHSETLDKANAEYRRRARAALTETLAQLNAGENSKLQFDLVQPRSFLSDYDNVIGMLEMAQSTTVDIEPHDFDQWVGNRWSWSQTFANTTSAYLAS